MLGWMSCVNEETQICSHSLHSSMYPQSILNTQPCWHHMCHLYMKSWITQRKVKCVCIWCPANTSSRLWLLWALLWALSWVLLWVLLLSLEFSVRPLGQQGHSHLDMIKLETAKKLNPVSQQDRHVGILIKFCALSAPSSHFYPDSFNC